MAEPYLGQITILAFDFAPKGYAFCDGQLLPINQNQSLYSILGTTYGGNGTTNFALPDLRGRVPISEAEQGYALGAKAGEEQHILSQSEMPQHSHPVSASSTAADAPIPAGNLLGAANNLYHDPSNLTGLRTGTLGTTGGGQGHENMQPYLAVRFCIATQGLFPPRN